MISSKKVLFDSNILVYAHNKRSPYFKKAKLLHEQVLAGELSAAIAQQNILEFLAIVTNPKIIPRFLTPGEAVEKVRTYLESPFEILEPNKQTLKMALDLIGQHKIKQKDIFDAYLVATMITNEVFTLYTANDQDFKKFADKIKIINPFKSK